MSKLKINQEYIFLLIVIGLLLWVGLGTIYEHKISHDYPHGFMATDSFLKLSRAKQLDASGNHECMPSYLNRGYTDVIETYPPGVSYLTVSLSKVAGIELYDSIFLLSIIYAILAALVMYIIIKDFNKKVAILSAGLLGFLFQTKFITGHIFGWSPLILGSLFLIVVFWILLRFDLKKSWILLGLFMAGAFLAHPPEAMIAAAFMLIYLGIGYVKERKVKKTIKDVTSFAKAAVISIMLAANYIIVFFVFGKQTYGSTSIIQFTKEVITKPAYPAPFLADFGIWLIPIVIGIIIAVLAFKKTKHLAIYASGFIVVYTFANYLRLVGHRVFQTRYLWPIFFAVFFGLGIYQICKLISKDVKKSYLMVISIFFLVLFIAIFFKPTQGTGLANEYNWDALMWIKENTPSDSTVYFFYGDSYSQHAFLSYTNRISYMTHTKSFIEGLQQGEVKQSYESRIVLNKPIFPYRKSLFTIGDHYFEDGPFDMDKERDICNFDYLIFDKVSRTPQLTQYNMLIRGELLSNEWIKEVYSNEAVSILKNNEKGKDCVGE